MTGVNLQQRFVTADELPAWRRQLGPAPLAVVTGTFDILQPGNLEAIGRARKAADHVLVVVESDEVAACHTSPGRPQNPLATRIEMVTHLRGVSAVTTVSVEAALEIFSQLNPLAWVVAATQRATDPLAPAFATAALPTRAIESVTGCFTEEINRAVREHRTPIVLPERICEAEVGRPVPWPPRRAGDCVPCQHEAKSACVSVNGCFDILHIGHLRFLAAARAMGDSLTVLINDDASVARYKGPSRPVFPARFRAAALMSLVSVDDVMTFAEDEPLAALGRLRPAIHVKGGSFEPERVRHERELMARWGGRIVGTPLVEGFSTSQYIAKALQERR
jgi:rfaE bifunctional protein nucleotidyltransferase chain/domain